MIPAIDPAFLLQVRDDVLTGNLGSYVPKQSPDLLNPRLMVPFLPVPHAALGVSSECVEPAVDFLEGLSEPLDGLSAMFVKRWHRDSPLPFRSHCEYREVFRSPRVFECSYSEATESSSVQVRDL
jgi:hypothetical protein